MARRRTGGASSAKVKAAPNSPATLSDFSQCAKFPTQYLCRQQKKKNDVTPCARVGGRVRGWWRKSKRAGVRAGALVIVHASHDHQNESEGKAQGRQSERPASAARARDTAGAGAGAAAASAAAVLRRALT